MNRFFCRLALALVVLGTLNLAAESCVPAPAGLVAWFRGEGDSSDSAGSLDATFVGADYAPGRVGLSFAFSGSNEVVIPDSPALALDAFTLEAWVYPTLVDGDVDIIANKEINGFQTTAYEFGVKGPLSLAENNTIPTGNLALFIGGVTGLPDNYGGWTDGGAAVPFNQWTHVAITYTPGKVQTFVNGELTRSFEGLGGMLRTTTGPLKIGSRSDAVVSQFPTSRFNGNIDEFSIYSRALTAAEIAAAYASGAAGKCVRDLALVTDGAAEIRAALGEDTTLTFRVENHGDSPATAVTVTNAVPPGLQIISLGGSQGTSQNLAGILRWDLGTIPAGTNATVTLTVHPLLAGTFDLSAGCSGAEPEATLANNTAPLTLTAVAQSVDAGPDVTAVEGDTVKLQFTLAAPTSHAITVPLTINLISATTNDFGTLPSSLEFARGVTNVEVAIPLVQDALYEGDESFTVTLGTPVGAPLGRSNLVVTIQDGDLPPVLRINDATVQEGNTGTTDLVFTVTLTGAAAMPVTVLAGTANDTAKSGTDYQAAQATLEFAPGETTKTFVVRVNGDTTPEANETFSASLTSPTNATLGDALGIGVILNDDHSTGQIDHFGWSEIPSPQSVGQPFAVALTALDASGQAVTDFSGVVQLGVFGDRGRPSSIVLTEIATGFNAGAHLINVSTNPVDIGGWTLSFYDPTRWPAPRVVFTVPNGTSVDPGQVISVEAGGVAPGAAPQFKLGTSLVWIAGVDPDSKRLGVVVQDAFRQIQDAFFAGQAFPRLVTAPVVVTENDWSGPAALFGPGVVSFQRWGNANHHRSDDWASPNSSFPQSHTNRALVLPFADANSVSLSPTMAMDFVKGVWAGNLQLDAFCSPASLFADDGNGHTGRSAPFTMFAPNDLAVSLSSPALLTTPFAGFYDVVTVTNPGPVVASNVVVELKLDPLYQSLSEENASVRLSQGSYSFGQYQSVTADFTRMAALVHAELGQLAAGAVATVEVKVTRANGFPPTPLTQAVTIATVSRTEPDVNPANNQVRAVAEVSNPCFYPFGPGPVAWWRGEGNGLDVIGTNVAQLADGVSYAPARVGQGFSFDGVVGQLVVPAAPALDFGPGQDFSLEAWIKVAQGTRSWIGLLDKRVGNGAGPGYALYLDEGRLALSLTDADGNSPAPLLATIPGDLRDERWHYVVASVARNGRVLLFVDGARMATRMPAGAGGDLGNTAPLRLGINAAGDPGTALAGQLDEVMIHARALNETDVSMQYRSGAHGRCVYGLAVAPVAPAFTNSSAGQWMAVMPGTVLQPYALTVAITNLGPGITPVFPMISFGGSVTILSQTSSQGSVTNDTYGTVTGDLGLLPAGAVATITVNLQTSRADEDGYLSVTGEPYVGIGQTSSAHIHFVVSDTDGDGLPDDWETQYGLNPSDPTDASSDRDGDGLTALEEYELGTAPNDPASALRLEPRSGAAAGELGLRVQTQPGRLYQLLRRDHLNSGDWTPIGGPVVGGGGPLDLTDSDPLPEGGYYRVTVTRQQ